jgi:transketolase
MNVICPVDYNQTYRTIIECSKINAPFYVRFYRDNSPNFTNPNAPFKFGTADMLYEGTDCTIISNGLCIWESMQAIEMLAKDKISVRLLNMHTIKPIDRDAIVRAAKETGVIVTVEDHQKNCGLGGAVAEVLAQEYPAPVEFVAANDTFGESGKGTELYVKYGISKNHIVEAVKRALKRKK